MAVSSTQGLGRLKGKVALVTGGGFSFGMAITEAFLREGASVLLGNLDTYGTEYLATKYPSSKLVVHAMDVAKREDWDAAVRVCVERLGGLDVLVNNAGTSYRNKPTMTVSEAEFMLCFDANVLSLFHGVGAAFPQLARNPKGGSVINVSSCGADRPREGLVWYNASKGAVSSATKGLALEFGPSKIRVNSICPLLTKAGLFEMILGVPDTPENKAKFLSNVPLGRLGNKQDMANAAVFLASDESSFITGVNLKVDGGRSI